LSRRGFVQMIDPGKKIEGFWGIGIKNNIKVLDVG
jgi:hypothetical protein